MEFIFIQNTFQHAWDAIRKKRIKKINETIFFSHSRSLPWQLSPASTSTEEGVGVRRNVCKYAYFA